MRKRLALVLAALTAQACTQATGPNNASTGAAAAEPAGTQARRDDVYIAFSRPRDGMSMLATFGGRFEVLDGCLVLRSPNGLHVPVFAPSGHTYVTATSAVIAGRSVALGTEVNVAGGEMGVKDDVVLDRPRPERCRHRLLRVSSWAPAG